MYKVYKHTSPNGKVYIGITNQKPERRWCKNGQGYKENEYFCRAIEKYGWNNFNHEILAENLTEEEACNMEIKLIEEFNSTDRSCGYNRHSGGKVHDTISKEDMLRCDFIPYSEIKKSEILYKVFKNIVHSALGFSYTEKVETEIYENGCLIETHTRQEEKIKKPSYFAIRLLLENYKNSDEVKDNIEKLTRLKFDIENDL